MGKYFRDISIHVKSPNDLPIFFTQKEFNITTHTVQDIFWYKIPSKFELMDISKLNISISSANKPNELLYYIEGIAEYLYNNFDFEKYFQLDYKGKNSIILTVLRNTIKDILKEQEEKLNQLITITNNIEEQDFILEMESKKLSKFHKNRRVRAVVIYRIDQNGQNAFLKIINKKGEELLKVHLLKNRLYDFHLKLHTTKWNNNSFEIIDKEGAIFKMFEIDL